MKNLILVNFLLFSTAAFAVPANIAVCNGYSKTGAPEKVVIRKDSGGQLVALYTTESFGGGYPTTSYKVQQMSGPGKISFVGKTFEVSINTGTSGPKYASFLTIGNFQTLSFTVKNEGLYCSINEE